MSNVFVIGVAGGIGSGKSTVAAEFRRLGAVVLDADAMVHRLLREPATVRKITRRFGTDVLTSRGTIDRARLGEVAFASKPKIRELEKMLHPTVVRRIKEKIATLERAGRRRVVVIDAPLLFEAALDGLCDEVVFVHAPKLERLKRLRKTRGWSRAELDKREKRQKPLNTKRENADTVIRNGASRRETRTQVQACWKRIRKLLRT